MLLLLALTASAAQMELPEGQLRVASDLRVLAEVTSTEVRWAEGDEGGLETVVWLSPLDASGPVDDTLSIVLPGGTLGDYTHWVEDVPSMQEDDRYVLFLRDSARGLRLVGASQGVKPVDRDLVVLPLEVR